MKPKQDYAYFCGDSKIESVQRDDFFISTKKRCLNFEHNIDLLNFFLNLDMILPYCSKFNFGFGTHCI